VFGLSYDTREADLRDVFARFGELDQVSVVYDKRSGHSRGFAFVYFARQEDAEQAVRETNGMVMQGKPVRVDFSVTQKAHDPTPGRYMGEVRRDDRRGHRRRSRSRDRYRRSRSRSRDRRYHYEGSGRYRSSPSRYRARSRSVERKYGRDSPRRYSPSPSRRHSRSPPRRFSRSPPRRLRSRSR
jgi:transformer-2 protein